MFLLHRDCCFRPICSYPANSSLFVSKVNHFHLLVSTRLTAVSFYSLHRTPRSAWNFRWSRQENHGKNMLHFSEHGHSSEGWAMAGKFGHIPQREQSAFVSSLCMRCRSEDFASHQTCGNIFTSIKSNHRWFQLPWSFQCVEMDFCLDESVELAKRCRRLGVNVHIDILSDLPHGFLNFALVSTHFIRPNRPIRIIHFYYLWFRETRMLQKDRCFAFGESRN